MDQGKNRVVICTEVWLQLMIHIIEMLVKCIITSSKMLQREALCKIQATTAIKMLIEVRIEVTIPRFHLSGGDELDGFLNPQLSIIISNFPQF